MRTANDSITNATAKLPVFQLFDIQGTLHLSSDGQRMETQIDTINARYSPKYFGLQKGVTAYIVLGDTVPEPLGLNAFAPERSLLHASHLNGRRDSAETRLEGRCVRQNHQGRLRCRGRPRSQLKPVAH